MRRARTLLVVALTAVSSVATVGAGSAFAADTTTAVASTAPAATPPQGDFDGLARTAAADGTVRVIVQMDTPAADAAPVLEGQLDGFHHEINATYTNLPLVAASLSEHAVRQLEDSPDVASVTPDEIRHVSDLSSGPVVGSPPAIAGGHNGGGWSVAIVDTGVQSDHPFLNGRVVHEECFASGTNAINLAVGSCPNGQRTMSGAGAGAPCPVASDCGHGTHVAGIAAGRDPGGAGATGYSGVGPQAGVVAIQVFSVFAGIGPCPTVSPCVGAYNSDIIKAINWVDTHRTQAGVGGWSIAALNLSLGGGQTFTSTAGCDAADPSTLTAVRQLKTDGVATVAAAGNAGVTTGLSAPACLSPVVSVGATTDADTIAGYSDYAPFLSLFAPGDNITSSIPGDAYGQLSGTSMAAPVVTGTWAVMKQQFPTDTPDQTLARIRSTGRPITAGSTVVPRVDIPAALSGTAPAPAIAAGGSGASGGYSVVSAAGEVFGFGSASYLGFLPVTPAHPVIGVTGTNSGAGVWMVATDGGIFTLGDAAFYGSTGAMKLNQPVVGLATTATGNGYWMVAKDGGIFSFGDAAFYGSTGALSLKAPIVGVTATPSGRGYWLVASDGGIFAFGDATFYGSTGARKLDQPVVGIAKTPSGHGYWMVAADGGIFSFGDAAFEGSTGGMRLTKPIVGMNPTPSGNGYRFVATDGGVFTFGDATFFGSAAGRTPSPIVGMTS